MYLVHLVGVARPDAGAQAVLRVVRDGDGLRRGRRTGVCETKTPPKKKTTLGKVSLTKHQIRGWRGVLCCVLQGNGSQWRRKVVLFAMAMASSSVLNVVTLVTGPKISSWKTRMSLVPWRIVGLM